MDDRTDQPMERGYHDFQKLLRRWGEPTTLTTYRLMEVVAGCAAAGVVFAARRRGRAQRVQLCAGLGLVWCTLFGPATESATYMLLAPVAAQAVLAVTGRPVWERVCVRGAYLLLLSVPVALWFPRSVSDPYRALIPQAHGALILLAWIVCNSGGLPRAGVRSLRLGVALASRFGLRMR
jgi:DMSO reductase anchor subunit